jgi:hypothetical protein
VINSWRMGRGLDTRTVSCCTGALGVIRHPFYLAFIRQPSKNR